MDYSPFLKWNFESIEQRNKFMSMLWNTRNNKKQKNNNVRFYFKLLLL